MTNLNKPQQALNYFLDSLKSYESSKAKLSSAKKNSFSFLYNLIDHFEEASGELYRLRATTQSHNPTRQRFEDQMSEASLTVLGLQKERKNFDPSQHWKSQYRLIWQNSIHLFVLACFLFLISLLMGWALAIKHPDYMPAIVDVEFLENIINKQAWFSRLQSQPLSGGLLIAWNNINVAIKCFIGGMLLGIGGLLALIYNGIHIGAIYGYCYRNGFHTQLTHFIASHGFLELTIIVVAAFASFLMGRAFYMRPLKFFKRRLNLSAKESFIIAWGAVPWLLLAGFIESVVSPWPQIPFSLKFSLGLFVTVLFWWWTFTTEPKSPQKL